MTQALERAKKLWLRWKGRQKAAADLRRVQGPDGGPGGPVVFAVMRNEALRLPRFLDHYRALGAARFVVVDNNSSDNTADILRAQGDVCLYATGSHFYGKEAWLDHLLRQHGVDRWCVVADADELLVYPGSDRLELPGLCRYLEETRCNAVHAILLDLYPRELNGNEGSPTGQGTFEQTWYFDPFPSLRRVPRHFYRGSGLDFRFEGGSRERIFGVAACCSKFPLFHYRPGMFLTDGQHYLEGARFSELRAVLYHFKYLPDFAQHVREEAVRGQHWKGAVEYRTYAEKLAGAEGSFVFHCAESLQLTGLRQLEECGFMVRPASLEEFLKREGNAP